MRESARMNQAAVFGAAVLAGSAAWCVWGVVYTVIMLTSFSDRAFGPQNEITTSATKLLWSVCLSNGVVACLLGCTWGLAAKRHLRFPWLCLAWFSSWILFHATFQAATGGNDICRWRDPFVWSMGFAFAVVAAAFACLGTRWSCARAACGQPPATRRARR